MENNTERTEGYKVVLAILSMFSFFGIMIFCSAETFRHFGVLSNLEEANLFGAYIVFLFISAFIYLKDELMGILLFVLTVFTFAFNVYTYFGEITAEQYKKIENIDKAAIKSVIGDKSFVNHWDYLNILENKELERRKNISSENEKELKSARDKVVK